MKVQTNKYKEILLKLTEPYMQHPNQNKILQTQDWGLSQPWQVVAKTKKVISYFLPVIDLPPPPNY